ncbi:MAG: 50S ribosomal protein L19e [Thaumarchaeota archaeon]|nr:50S ribosomal protein L19e [Candidatus Calditenuaceae archaeon]MDW8186960.1 50S ribosomal protein L19e [Nitrososphaerota archaeon]
MQLRLQRRLAADLLGVGENRVRFDPERLEDVEDAITREDVRALIAEGVIYTKPVTGQTRLRAKEKRMRKGGKYSTLTRKERWAMRVRAQRRYLKRLRDNGVIDRSTYRRLYLQAKAGRFKSVADIRNLLTEMRKLGKR